MDNVLEQRVNLLVQEVVSKEYPDHIFTTHACEVLSRLIMEAVGNGVIRSDYDGIRKFVKGDTLPSFDCKAFIDERQPFIEPVPNDVIEHIETAFSAGSLSAYNPIAVCRKSNIAEDNYLYSVLAQKNDSGEYACWSNWNENTQSLNFGHYNISSKDEAVLIISQFFNDITDEIDKYGPQRTMREINNKQRLDRSKALENTAAITAQRHLVRS